MQMLNVFEPNAWQMDIPAWPATAVRIDAYRLGTDVPTAPTVVYDCASVEDGAQFAIDAAAERGWKKFVVKPSPSSWSRGVEAFLTKSAQVNPQRVEKYFRENEPSAKSILVQRHLGGLARLPETRCFFVGGEFVGGCHDGGLGGTIPLLRMGLLQAMAERAAGERVKQIQAAHAAAGDELARLRRQLAAEKKD